MTQAITDDDIFSGLSNDPRPINLLSDEDIFSGLSSGSDEEVRNLPLPLRTRAIDFRTPTLERGKIGELGASLATDAVTLAKSAVVFKNAMSISLSNDLSALFGTEKTNLDLTNSTAMLDEILTSESFRASDSISGPEPQLTNPLWWIRLLGSNSLTFGLQIGGSGVFRRGNKFVGFAKC